MKKIKKEIKFTNTLKLVNKLRRLKKGFIITKKFKNSKINFTNFNNGIKFKLFYGLSDISTKQWNYYNVNIKSSSINLHIPILNINKKTNNVCYGEIYSFEYDAFDNDNKKIHRLLLPVDSHLNFNYSIENIALSYKQGVTSEATEISFNNNIFYLYLTHYKTKTTDNKFLVIDCETSLSYLEFSNFCSSILICFGYITGDFIYNDGFYLQYDNIDKDIISGLRYKQLSGSIKCHYNPIYIEAYGVLYNIKKSKIYQNILRTLTLKEFSELCLLCYSNDDIKKLLLILLEVNDHSLNTSLGDLSIALEKITNIIYLENKEVKSLIRSKTSDKKSKSLVKNLKKELLAVLYKFEYDMTEEGFNITKNKIENINQLTNKDKLLLPFEILKIPITYNDEQTIEQRNVILHGNIPKIPKIPKIINGILENINVNKDDKLCYYHFLRLNVLISSIILKKIGFDNYIVNYPKVYEKFTGIKLNEEYYRKI